jgi:hypothetical protein
MEDTNTEVAPEHGICLSFYLFILGNPAGIWHLQYTLPWPELQYLVGTYHMGLQLSSWRFVLTCGMWEATQ